MDILSEIMELFDYGDTLLLVINIAFILIARALFAVSVYMLAQKKKMSSSGSYAGYTAVFGIVGFIIFVIATRKEKAEKTRFPAVLAIVAGVIFVVNCVLFVHNYSIAKLNEKRDYYGFDSSVGIFVNDRNEEIRYNSLGQAFTLDNMDGFFYETKDGERMRYEAVKYRNYLSSYSFGTYFIDEDGYIADFTNGDYDYAELNSHTTVYFDENGKLYYNLDNCYFDKNGNIIFADPVLEKVTYDSVIKFLQSKGSIYNYAYKNDKGIYVFYDKMGNERPVTYSYGNRFYDREGNIYTLTYGDKCDVLKCTDGKSYPEDDFFIDEQGYAVVKKQSSLYSYGVNIEYNENDCRFTNVYYDNDGNLFYKISDCYWDKNGNLHLVNEVKAVTAEKIKSNDEIVISKEINIG